MFNKNTVDIPGTGLALTRLINKNHEKEFLCPLCKKIIWKPIICSKCFGAFCQVCFDKAQKKPEQVCPTCNVSFIKVAHTTNMMYWLWKLELFCAFANFGCKAIVAYEKLEEHENECPYKTFLCIYCKQYILKKEEDRHASVCDRYPTFCQDCNASFLKKDRESHTLDICVKNQLRNSEKKIKDLLDEYKEEVTSLKKNLQDQIDELKKQNSELNNEITRLKGQHFDEIKRLKQENSTLTIRLNTLQYNIQTNSQKTRLIS